MMKRKSKGNIAIWGLFLWFLLVIMILVPFLVEYANIYLKSSVTRNDIVYSNLAVYRNLDILALGDTPSSLVISDTNAAINTFKIYIEKNLKLDDNLKGKPNSIAVGIVNIKSYIIYNINGASADIFTYNNNLGSFSELTIPDINVSPVITPYGTIVRKTSIHTELEFDIEPLLKGINGKLRKVAVMADTDITQ